MTNCQGLSIVVDMLVDRGQVQVQNERITDHAAYLKMFKFARCSITDFYYEVIPSGRFCMYRSRGGHCAI